MWNNDYKVPVSKGKDLEIRETFYWSQFQSTEGKSQMQWS